MTPPALSEIELLRADVRIVAEHLKIVHARVADGGEFGHILAIVDLLEEAINRRQEVDDVSSV